VRTACRLGLGAVPDFCRPVATSRQRNDANEIAGHCVLDQRHRQNIGDAAAACRSARGRVFASWYGLDLDGAEFFQRVADQLFGYLMHAGT
jgi:hypothetical protein